ncbi:MAG: hypothetical protein JRC99_06610 [Deltaproteobacteria bacterium]|nr:hypothetical protein [Deltaproteobacteria bacterium]RLB66713.1 MAG: hypothetical protein DRH08_05475 [Deltaproteobacteria bacterium]
MILGFAGKAATGKTTAANHMAPLLDKECKIVPMAMVLRDEVEAFLRAVGADESVPLVYGCQDDKVRVFYVDEQQGLTHCPKWLHFISEHQEIQDKPGQTAVTVRRILQWWGTEYRREQDPDYWTKAWGHKIEQFNLEHFHVLIDDVRFMNELDAIKQHGGLIVKIERPGFDGANNHASETSLDEYNAWDKILLNDGTLEEFKVMVEQLARSKGWAKV